MVEVQVLVGYIDATGELHFIVNQPLGVEEVAVFDKKGQLIKRFSYSGCPKRVEEYYKMPKGWFPVSISVKDCQDHVWMKYGPFTPEGDTVEIQIKGIYKTLAKVKISKKKYH